MYTNTPHHISSGTSPLGEPNHPRHWTAAVGPAARATGVAYLRSAVRARSRTWRGRRLDLIGAWCAALAMSWCGWVGGEKKQFNWGRMGQIEDLLTGVFFWIQQFIEEQADAPLLEYTPVG